jgi:hypothetical protein
VQARRAEEAKREAEDKEKRDKENAMRRVAGESALIFLPQAVCLKEQLHVVHCFVVTL